MTCGEFYVILLSMEKIQEAMTIEQAAQQVGADRGTLYRAIKRGELEAVRVPDRGVRGQLYILPRDLESYRARPYNRKEEGEAE